MHFPLLNMKEKIKQYVSFIFIRNHQISLMLHSILIQIIEYFNIIFRMNNQKTLRKSKTATTAKVIYVAKSYCQPNPIKQEAQILNNPSEKHRAEQKDIYLEANECTQSSQRSNEELSFKSLQVNNQKVKMGQMLKAKQYVEKHIVKNHRNQTAVVHKDFLSVTRSTNNTFVHKQGSFKQIGVNQIIADKNQKYIGKNARKQTYEQQRDRDHDEEIRKPRSKDVSSFQHYQGHLSILDVDQKIDTDFKIERQEFFNFIIHQALTFKLAKKVVVKNKFKDQNQYMETMMLMIKQQASASILQNIQKQKEKTQKNCLKVSLRKIGQRSIFSEKDQIEIYTQASNEQRLKSILLKGACLGIITKSLPINKNKLIKSQSFLCLVRAIFITGKIIVEGLDNLSDQYKIANLKQNYSTISNRQLKQNQFYFVDLGPISSIQREYIAVSRSLQSPLLSTISNNYLLPQSQMQLKRRKQSLKSNIFKQIEKHRNPSQVQAIRTAFQNDTGIYLIQGPPGTGKTECITNLIGLQYYHQIKTKQNKKILVCAQSNAAVDHIARKILKNGLIGIDKNPSILKLGAADLIEGGGLDINLKHICQIDVLEIENKRQKWSVSLLEKCEDLKQKLQKEKQRGSSFKIQNFLRLQLRDALNALQQNKKNLANKRKQLGVVEKQNIDRCQIIFTTLNTSGNTEILNLIRDKIACVIIDQASQATESSTLIPLLTGVKKMILVGDHMQLQPTVLSKKTKKAKYNRSLFERLADCGVKPHLLNIQYRMHPQLNRFSSKEFYQNKVEDGSKLSTPTFLKKMQKASLLVDLLSSKQGSKNKSYYNEAEANCILSLVSMLLREDKKLQIGIISPYKQQINLIEQKVQELFSESRQDMHVRVSTVDAFQGQEVDVVIFSCVRANSQSQIGFVNDKKRLNVAITRAKHAAFIIGHMNTFKKDSIWKAFINHHNKEKSFKTAANDKSCRQIFTENIFGTTRQNIRP